MLHTPNKIQSKCSRSSLCCTPQQSTSCHLLFFHIQKMYLACRYEVDERALPWNLQRCFPPEINVASIIMHLPPFIYSPRTRLQKLQTRDVKFKLHGAKEGKGIIVIIKECRRLFKRYVRKNLSYTRKLEYFTFLIKKCIKIIKYSILLYFHVSADVYLTSPWRAKS